MEIKKPKGIAGIDVIVAVMSLMIFSTLIISLIYNNALENAKLKQESLVMIYITEIFENIARASYENVTETNKDQFMPSKVKENKNYKVDFKVTEDLEGVTDNKKILKKVKVTFTYLVGNKNYTCSMERMKIKE